MVLICDKRIVGRRANTILDNLPYSRVKDYEMYILHTYCIFH